VHVVIPNSVPVPSFTFIKSGLSASFDASGSTDADNDPLTYAWDFGDSTSGTGKTVSHTYTTAVEKTYQVQLTVSDGKDSASVTQAVTVTPPPTEDVLAQDGFERSATGAWGAADKGGTWTLSGGSAAFSVAGGKGLVTLTPGQTRSAALTGVTGLATVTDLKVSTSATSVGGISSATIVGRQIGTAFYSVRVRYELTGKVRLQLIRMSGTEAALGSIYELPDSYTPGGLINVRLSVTGSSPTTVSAKAWMDGASEPANWQVTATDSTAGLQAAGYVALRSAASSASTVASTVLSYDAYKVTTGSAPGVNTPPVAAFTSTIDGLTANLDAGGSTDADGNTLTYAWDFGDSTSGTGKTPSHTYGAAGTYPVKLTVSDGKDTDSVTHSVTVTAPAVTVIAKDDFARTVAAGSWGTADTGGAWTLSGGSAEFSVGGGVGKVAVPIGATREARLTSVTGTDATVDATVATDVVPTAGTTSATIIGRRVSTSYYAARVRFEAGGVVRLYLLRDETSLASMVVPGTYTPGTVINVRVAVTGTSPTKIQGKAWFAGTTEPSGWMKEATDSTAAMQAAGYVALRSSTSSAAGAAVNLSYDGYRVTKLG
jgi:PKD repeat protein